MKLKKILSSVIIGAIILTVPIITNNFDFNISTVEAAKGGAKISLPKSTPKVNLQKTPATSNSAKTPATSSNADKAKSNDESKSVSGGGKEYKPSQNAKDLQSNAPAAKSNNTNINTGSTFGNTLRNIGLFAGGMMLGGLIGSLLGDFGSGFFGDVLGLLFNVIMIYAAYKGVRYLWNKFQGNKNKTQNKIEDFQPIDVTPPQAINYPNQSTIGMDYDSKRAAEHYRNL